MTSLRQVFLQVRINKVAAVSTDKIIIEQGRCMEKSAFHSKLWYHSGGICCGVPFRVLFYGMVTSTYGYERVTIPYPSGIPLKAATPHPTQQ